MSLTEIRDRKGAFSRSSGLKMKAEDLAQKVSLQPKPNPSLSANYSL
jgi:hypothetical protein